MIKRILVIWAIANFAIVAIVSWLVGGWYLGWHMSPVSRMVAELVLIMVPNLLLPGLVLRYWWPEPVRNIRESLGWRCNGWRSLVAGVIGFTFFFVLLKVIVRLVGDSIPYHPPGSTGEGISIIEPSDLLRVLGMLLVLLAFLIITVAGEETMFRGWIQTQLAGRYGAWIGLSVSAVLFGLRHLPADIFYAQIWQATPNMWLSRQLQLYIGAICLGLARLYGKSTYASAMMHALIFLVALLGLG
ncbi:MAG: CPBP family intramembrane metalloprotease [candidate division KSB1 bacterium]|nr:CPBP family intramembrane metalloprotease [candidate division KSB1 bacterium]MDZ7336131.1 CPBP family intramembrane metalloprotease [candidate division KSB1 bacterium]MDZ7399682.1 CPBP family intramembrane metalloprotease [candidate division KSB1 bacterium]